LSGFVQGVRRFVIGSSDELAKTALNAGFWAAALSVTAQLLRLIRTALLARLLAPDDFGLMSIALLTLGLLQMLTESGVERALVQRRGDIRHHLNAAWTIAVLRGLFLGGAVFFAAPLVGKFFHSNEAIAIVRVMAASVLLRGLNNIGVVLFDRDLQFRQRFIVRSLPKVVDLVVSVGSALILRSVWALVLVTLAGQLTLTLGSYIAHPYRPRISFDVERFRDLFRFGKWILGGSIAVYLMLNLDDIVVGRLLGPTELGFYHIAFTMSALVVTQVTSIVNQVTFPLFSRLQEEDHRLQRAYERSLQLISMVSFPVAAGLWFVGPMAVQTFLGSRWLYMMPTFSVLLIWSVFRSIGGSAMPLFEGVGKPAIGTGIYTTTVVILAALIYPLTSRGGITGAAWATVVAATPFVVAPFLAGRLLAMRASRVLYSISVPALSSALMLAALGLIRELSPALGGKWLLVWAPAVGVVTYGVALAAARRFTGYAAGGH